MADADEDLIGSAEAAEILGRSQRSIQRAASTGAIPIVGRFGKQGDAVFRKAEIEALAKKEGDEPAP